MYVFFKAIIRGRICIGQCHEDYVDAVDELIHQCEEGYPKSNFKDLLDIVNNEIAMRDYDCSGLEVLQKCQTIGVGHVEWEK